MASRRSSFPRTGGTSSRHNDRDWDRVAQLLGGLAIGKAANVGESSLAILLPVGFALHNATAGFGLVGPLAGARVRASWGWLLGASLIVGVPAAFGAMLGTALSSDYVFVGFLVLAGGAILFVIGELFASGCRLSWTLTPWRVLAGFLFELATDLIIVGRRIARERLVSASPRSLAPEATTIPTESE